MLLFPRMRWWQSLRFPGRMESTAGEQGAAGDALREAAQEPPACSLQDGETCFSSQPNSHQLDALCTSSPWASVFPTVKWATGFASPEPPPTCGMALS